MERKSRSIRILGYSVSAVLSVGVLVAGFLSWYTSWTEAIAAVSGVWCVWLIVKENVWNWPVGLATSVFSGIVFYDQGFIGDAFLQIVYLVLGILGWYWWLHGGRGHTELRIAVTPLWEWGCLLGLGAISQYVIWFFLSRYGSAPFWDSFTTALSLAAQYLTTRKRIENWWLWIVANVIYIPLYVWKGLNLIAVLYFIYLVLAIAGLVEWRKRLLAQAESHNFVPR